MCEVVSKTLLKNPLFSKKTHCFQTSALFYPIVLKRKNITDPHPSPQSGGGIKLKVPNEDPGPWNSAEVWAGRSKSVPVSPQGVLLAFRAVGRKEGATWGSLDEGRLWSQTDVFVVVIGTPLNWDLCWVAVVSTWAKIQMLIVLMMFVSVQILFVVLAIFNVFSIIIYVVYLKTEIPSIDA